MNHHVVSVEPNQVARLRCTAEFFTGLLSIAHQCEKGTSRFRVIKNGLPADVKVDHSRYDGDDLILVLRSCAFAPVELGADIPFIESPIFETIRHEG